MDQTIQRKIEILDAIKVLQANIQCDFVGLAFQEKDGPTINWQFATGNSNSKYERISVRYGKGIAGRVISTGRPYQIRNFPEQIIGKALEYPIMLAEKLLFAYAVPILISGIPKGVLLVGERGDFELTDTAKSLVHKTAVLIEKLLH